MSLPFFFYAQKSNTTEGRCFLDSVASLRVLKNMNNEKDVWQYITLILYILDGGYVKYFC